jgi:hypothetical protein
MFRDLIPALADQFRIVAPDLPGFGQTDMPPRDKFAYTFAKLAEVIERFTELIGLARFALAGGTALALLLVSGAVLWALRSNQPRNPATDDLYSTDHHNVADELASLPKDYAGIPHDVPRLGPPLPGDNGRIWYEAEAKCPSCAPAFLEHTFREPFR